MHMHCCGLNSRGGILYSSIGRGCVGSLAYVSVCFGELCHAWDYLTLFPKGVPLILTLTLYSPSMFDASVLSV